MFCFGFVSGFKFIRTGYFVFISWSMISKCSSSETTGHWSNSLANTTEFLAQKFQISCHQSRQIYSHGSCVFVKEDFFRNWKRAITLVYMKKRKYPTFHKQSFKPTSKTNNQFEYEGGFFCCVTAAGDNYSLCNLVKAEAWGLLFFN